MFLDVGVGILFSILLSNFLGVDLSHQLILAGAGFSLVADLDIFMELARRGRVGGRVQGHHRELTHFPLTYLPALALVYWFWGQVYGALFGLTVLAHFLHDSVGMGWGIKWLWPFSNRSYKFFSEKNGKFSSRFLVSWPPAELKEVIRRHGDDHWLRNFYFKLHPIAVFEFLFFISSLVVLLYYIEK